MDPTKTLFGALMNIEDIGRFKDAGHDDSADLARDDAVESLRDLADWLERDGYSPDIEIVLSKISLYLSIDSQ